LEHQGADRRIILEWILGKQDGRCGLNASGLGQGAVADSCEHGNEPFGSIQGEEFLDLWRRTLPHGLS